MPWSEMDNGPGLSARPWPCPFTSGAQFKLDNASSGQFPSPTATTHLKGQSLLWGHLLALNSIFSTKCTERLMLLTLRVCVCVCVFEK